MSICIAERPHVQIRLRLHDQIGEELRRDGKDYRAYLRDRLTRTLGERFGRGVLFFFVLEDLGRDGLTDAPAHAHGMASLPRIDLDAATDGRIKAGYRRKIETLGRVGAEFSVSREALRNALQAAVGNGKNRPNPYKGRAQEGNVWTKRSYNPLFSKEAVSYAFKNVDASMSSLPANRIARSRDLATEATRFWDLVRLGEKAVGAWSGI